MDRLTYPRIIDIPYCRLEPDDCLRWIMSQESECSRQCSEHGCQHMAEKALKSVMQTVWDCKDSIEITPGVTKVVDVKL